MENITSSLSHYVRKNSQQFLLQYFIPVEDVVLYLLVGSSDESYRLMDRLKPHWWRDLLRHLDLKKTLSAFGSMNMANYSSGGFTPSAGISPAVRVLLLL